MSYSQLSNILKPAILTIASLWLATGIPQTSNASNAFYTCNSGERFETGLKSARCVLPEKNIFRPILPCERLNTQKTRYRLSVDEVKNNDLCVIVSSIKDSTHSVKTSITPNCLPGFVLYIKKGKDSCRKFIARKISPPKKKVVQSRP